jgi:uncharacterized membrane-anchored protein
MKQMKSLFWGIFGLLCVIQLGVIGIQIWSYERILKEGEVYYFNVLPLDPYDAFRGRYVTLRFENANKAVTHDGELNQNTSKAYAILEHNENNDSIKEVRFSKPHEPHFLEVNVYKSTAQKADTSNFVYFSLPFDRFYLREDRAPQAEKLLRARSGVKVKAKLRVLDGKGVVEDLMVGETPLSSYLTK